MKDAVYIIVGLLLGVLVSFGSLHYKDAKSPVSLPEISKGSTEAGILSASANSFVMAKPDMAVLSMTLQSRGPKLDALVFEVNQKTSLLLQRLKDSGIAERDIQTNLTTYPQYNPKSTSLKVIGYDVSNRLVVKLRNLNKVGDVLDTAIAGGVSSLENINWIIEDDEKYKTQARAAAVRLVMSKVKDMADAADIKIGKIISLHEEFSNQEGAQTYELKQSMPSQGIVSESGMIKVTSQVSVSVQIKS